MAAFHAGGTQHLVGVDTQASPLTFGQKSAPYRNSMAGVTLDTGLPFRIPFEMVNHRCTEWGVHDPFRSPGPSVNGLRLAVDEIVHHNNIQFSAIIGARGRADCDPHTGDTSIIKNDSEKRQSAVSW